MKTRTSLTDISAAGKELNEEQTERCLRRDVAGVQHRQLRREHVLLG
ncbi:hypothetical protein OG589_11835 [Sphaerisporangium sp. NBC_01403]